MQAFFRLGLDSLSLNILGNSPIAPAPSWNQAENVFTGKLDQVAFKLAGPVDEPIPPVYLHGLQFTVENVLRGRFKPGEHVVCEHVVRQSAKPAFPIGKACLVAARKIHGGITAQRVVEADAETLAAVELACGLPLGWNTESGNLISPWAVLGKAAWPEGLDADAKLKCAKTGRPALLAGSSVSFTVVSVPPKKQVALTNPDGDGKYKIIVTNTTDQPVSVPALLSDGNSVLWEESIVILCQGNANICPGCKGISAKVSPTTIPAGGSVSAVVNALRLQGPQWPRGGDRIEFQICLGEMSRTQSFYYMSPFHDAVRAAANEKQ